ncbi:hypothetical protein GNI_013000, partial [Gregarina niphandrodes]
FVYKGEVKNPFQSILELGLTDEETVFYLENSPPQSSGSGPVPAAPTPSVPMISKMLQDPFVQLLMNSPDLLQILFDSNPQIQQLKRSNPQISALFSDPKEILDLMKTLSNPAAAREMLKATDRALNNVEAVPGGMDAIRSLYNDFTTMPAEEEDSPPPSDPTHLVIRRNDIEDTPFPR